MYVCNYRVAGQYGTGPVVLLQTRLVTWSRRVLNCRSSTRCWTAERYREDDANEHPAASFPHFALRALPHPVCFVRSVASRLDCMRHPSPTPTTDEVPAAAQGSPPPPPGIAPHPIRGLISLLHKGLRKASRGGRSTHMYSASLPIRTRGKRVKGPPRGRRRRRRPASSLRGLLLPLIRPPIHPKHQHHLLIR